jgi:hypothetical protein
MGWNATPLPLYPREDRVPFVLEVGWARGSVWTGAENLVQPGFDPAVVILNLKKNGHCAAQ